MSEPANLAIRIILHIVGIALIIMAVLVFLKGLGVLKSIPEYVAWGLALFAIGSGIIAGLRSGRK